MTNKKTKILVIADSPLAPSGVGTQIRYMIESLLETGKYSFICLAGAIKHQDYRPQKIEGYGDDWVILPVDGYGNQETIRSLIDAQRPDALWFMTDPRFFTWLWEIEDEIRTRIPMIYYHVWDNYPYPTFNKPFYDSNDLVCTISKVTDDIVRTVSPGVECIRVPHAVDNDIYRRYSKDKYLETRNQVTGGDDDCMLFFWNSRNARRKQSGTLLFWFNDFLNEVGRDKAKLIMHTEPKDPNGQDLVAIMKSLDLMGGQVLLSTEKIPPKQLALVYNAVDCTIAISDAEGFGLSIMESLSCETPVVVTMTGGLQEQVTDGEEWFGIGIEPSSKAVIGSQEVPWIYEDRINKEDFLAALRKMYNMSKEEREEMGKKARNHVMTNYSMESFRNQWSEIFEKVTTEMGSWETRKNYKPWELISL
jgi:glycosyltransferase involved in cell wall biosynthesis